MEFLMHSDPFTELRETADLTLPECSLFCEELFGNCCGIVTVLRADIIVSIWDSQSNLSLPVTSSRKLCSSRALVALDGISSAASLCETCRSVKFCYACSS